MMTKSLICSSDIGWTDAVWNPITGCTQISSGCQKCYAKTMHKRQQAIRQSRLAKGLFVSGKYAEPFNKVVCHESQLAGRFPGKGKRIFVNSMSDLFHRDVPFGFIERVFQKITNNPQHTFQVLTKRATRLAQLAHKLPWPKNLWLGVSVEDSAYWRRVEQLTCCPAEAAVKFISFEPLLGKVEIGPNYCKPFSWVIVGGETGSGARPMEIEWVRAIRDQCIATEIPFFFKGWGAGSKLKGDVLDGVTWEQFPEGFERKDLT